MAILCGCAVSAMGIPGADHTYACTGDGKYAWGCFGRNSGGNTISSGTGSAAQADCLSLPNSEAGIIYGVTGVCHQAANRILLPAGITVQNARGYALSQALFGAYGTDTATWLSGQVRRCSGGGDFAIQDKPLSPTPDGKFARLVMEHYRNNGHRLSGGPLTLGAIIDNLGFEFETYLEFRLGTSLSEGERQTLTSMQAGALEELHLGNWGQLPSPKALIRNVNNASSQLAGRMAEFLGVGRYKDLTGLAPTATFNIMDTAAVSVVEIVE